MSAEGICVTFHPSGARASGEPGVPMIRLAHRAGVEIVATCGQRGICTSCRVKVLRGPVPPPTIMDRIQLGEEEVREGYRLSCQTPALGDVEVLVAPRIAEAGFQILASSLEEGAGLEAGAGVRPAPGVEKRLIRASPPRSEHHQTSDVEETLAALGEPVQPLPLDLMRKIPTLLRDSGGGLTATLFGREVLDLEAGDTRAALYGIAFDIGTTTVVGSLLDLQTGQLLAQASSLNPQAVHGGDLMSRIAFAQQEKGGLRRLHAKIVGLLNDQIEEMTGQAAVSPDHVYKVVVVGNTCMHHLFLGIDPTFVGLAPYAPVTRAAFCGTARDLLLKVNPRARVLLLPIVAGFVGADAVAVALASRIYEGGRIRVAVDIGTNGEVIMGCRDRLMACSAPAGPALEGAQIRHGMRAATGAIDAVEFGGDVRVHVIGGVPPLGICGSGLLDAVAGMLDAGVVDPTGLIDLDRREALPSGLRDRVRRRGEEREFLLVPGAQAGIGRDIVLTQGDLRQVQLAKGAISSGILMLQRVMGVKDEEIAELLLAGGFGNYLNIRSAQRIRLIPPLPRERVTYIGNAASLGAQLALISEAERARADDLARRIEHVSLAASPDFQDIFVGALNFPEG